MCLGAYVCCFCFFWCGQYLALWVTLSLKWEWVCASEASKRVRSGRSTCQFWEIPRRSCTVTAFSLGRALSVYSSSLCCSCRNTEPAIKCIKHRRRSSSVIAGDGKPNWNEQPRSVEEWLYGVNLKRMWSAVMCIWMSFIGSLLELSRWLWSCHAERSSVTGRLTEDERFEESLEMDCEVKV